MFDIKSFYEAKDVKDAVEALVRSLRQKSSAVVLTYSSV